ncbi:ABC transporter permease [Chitinispirillales bacterium ANBcel5]|uniref:ABC transporter permease n=1 Tax=Cellulosispirillum alkaliphilum TaxID=3039283 RepID=UPI002A587586|nr:ABC transporter permease [Chitinispirillales bacterium ANBcel5]
MIDELFRRVMISVPQLLLMSFITFLFIDLAPGDILANYRFDPRISDETVREIEERFHFDKPIIIQYGHWLRRAVQLDFGYSFSRHANVTSVISERLFNTLLLSFFSILFTWLIAIPLGIYAAVKQYSIGDRILSFISYFGMSLPGFFLALLVMYLVYLGRDMPFLSAIPIGGMVSSGYENLSFVGKLIDRAAHMIIPVTVLTFGALAGLQRISRGNMLEELRKQYVVTARAKGLSEHRVVYRHALRNAVNPLITLFGYQFSSLLSGAALIEIIVNWPGLGSLMLAAVRAQDVFLVMGSMMIGGVMLIIGNMIADILLLVADPRVRR